MQASRLHVQPLCISCMTSFQQFFCRFILSVRAIGLGERIRKNSTNSAKNLGRASGRGTRPKIQNKLSRQRCHHPPNVDLAPRPIRARLAPRIVSELFPCAILLPNHAVPKVCAARHGVGSSASHADLLACQVVCCFRLEALGEHGNLRAAPSRPSRSPPPSVF
ncbi:hypothetical protein L227DRAFT_148372 [Lentinus tigrinus ALCF2SS1-6]|uniref:Uncharacterized protein n=1 Tax=Lentinus tigrinus ALCF2SS1-6 TaxID=1328759 RepID=A0A5C2SRS1_9APHY|nr:hypothetical protein L227DRAFT_148372 [Lentinus tigrinus ALCF2SS1-6]